MPSRVGVGHLTIFQCLVLLQR